MRNLLGADAALWLPSRLHSQGPIRKCLRSPLYYLPGQKQDPDYKAEAWETRHLHRHGQPAVSGADWAGPAARLIFSVPGLSFRAHTSGLGIQAIQVGSAGPTAPSIGLLSAEHAPRCVAMGQPTKLQTKTHQRAQCTHHACGSLQSAARFALRPVQGAGGLAAPPACCDAACYFPRGTPQMPHRATGVLGAQAMALRNPKTHAHARAHLPRTSTGAQSSSYSAEVPSISTCCGGRYCPLCPWRPVHTSKDADTQCKAVRQIEMTLAMRTSPHHGHQAQCGRNADSPPAYAAPRI